LWRFGIWQLHNRQIKILLTILVCAR
jgi:hypothetical protein